MLMNTVIMLLLTEKRSGCSLVPAHHIVRGIVLLRQSLLGTTDSPALKRSGQTLSAMVHCSVIIAQPLLRVLILQAPFNGGLQVGAGDTLHKSQVTDKACKWYSKTPTRACPVLSAGLGGSICRWQGQ